MKRLLIFICLIPSIVFGANGKLFNGTDDVISIANESDYDFMTNEDEPYTVILWLHTSETAAGRIVTKMNNFATGGFQIFHDGSSNRLRSSNGHNSTNFLAPGTDTNSISDNTLYHVAITYNGQDYSTIGNYQWYIDGLPVNTSDTGSDGTPVTSDESDPIRIGSMGVGNFYTGSIFNVRIYNRALSDEEVFISYQCDNQPINGLAGQWLLTNDDNDYEDLSVKGDDGTCTACPDNTNVDRQVEWCGSNQ